MDYQQNGEPHYYTVNKETQFSQTYMEEQDGKIEVETPEVYELFHVAFALTDFVEQYPHPLDKKSNYFKEVQEYFEPYKDHKLIQKMDQKLKNKDMFAGIMRYIEMKRNIYPYDLYGNQVQHRLMYSKYDVFIENHLKLFEDFAKQSNYQQFYADHLALYQEIINDYHRLVPIKRMWDWLETKTLIHVNTYRIIISPLVGATHNTTNYVDATTGFKEILMFVSAPTLSPLLKRDDLSHQVVESELSRVVFTEIDHNYVNRITDQYAEEVDRVFQDLDFWNQQSNYRSPYATFNEYMTWAVFILYAYDTYEHEDFVVLKDRVINQMVQSRKFVKFREFTDHLLERYVNLPDGAILEQLYDDVLEWAKSTTI